MYLELCIRYVENKLRFHTSKEKLQNIMLQQGFLQWKVMLCVCTALHAIIYTMGDNPTADSKSICYWVGFYSNFWLYVCSNATRFRNQVAIHYKCNNMKIGKHSINLFMMINMIEIILFIHWCAIWNILLILCFFI